MRSSTRHFDPATDESNPIGFRVAAAIPEPGSGALLLAGLLGLSGARRAYA